MEVVDRWLILALLVSSFAGCFQGAEPVPTEEEKPGALPTIEATAETGGIRGVVVDQTIAPIPSVRIAIEGEDRFATTDEDGIFTFKGLQPGTYRITATAEGYEPAQTLAEVVAGDIAPDIIRILMDADRKVSDFVVIESWNAHIQCGVYLVTGSNLCLSANGYTIEFVEGRVPATVLSEAVWEPTQLLGTHLELGYYGDPDVIGPWTVADSASPLLLRTSAAEFIQAYGDAATEAQVFIFPGGGNTGVGPGIALDQGYEIFFSHFYGFEPRADYTFVGNGACEPITTCQ